MLTPEGRRPTLIDYQSAVARLEQCGGDPRLKRCVPVLDSDGRPGADGGTFGAVYRLNDLTDGRSWALKCFLRHEPDRERRYRAIALGLEAARGSWRTEARYVEEGLWVHDRWWPVVLMEWVTGVRLTDWIDELLAQRPAKAAEELRRLAHRFAGAVHQMHRSGISHGDLQSGNVLVEPGTAVRFVDYDAMIVPSWTKPPRREDGHPDFRMPRPGERGPDGATEVLHTAPSLGTSGPAFTTSTSTSVPLTAPDILTATHRDRFPSHVIHSALLMLSHDVSLWADLHRPGGDHLLLARKDFRDPTSSDAWRVLLRHSDTGVRGAAEHLRALLDCPTELQPDLEPRPEVAPNESVLKGMAWRPATGPRPSPRPFLDLGHIAYPEPSDASAVWTASFDATARDTRRADEPTHSPSDRLDHRAPTEPKRPPREARAVPHPAAEPAPAPPPPRDPFDAFVRRASGESKGNGHEARTIPTQRPAPGPAHVPGSAAASDSGGGDSARAGRSFHSPGAFVRGTAAAILAAVIAAAMVALVVYLLR